MSSIFSPLRCSDSRRPHRQKPRQSWTRQCFRKPFRFAHPWCFVTVTAADVFFWRFSPFANCRGCRTGLNRVSEICLKPNSFERFPKSSTSASTILSIGCRLADSIWHAKSCSTKLKATDDPGKNRQRTIEHGFRLSRRSSKDDPPLQMSGFKLSGLRPSVSTACFCQAVPHRS